ncbi:MAG: hypothetical protein KAS23_11400 [Anaerohalosphaera sp.]|nr:hypothetical protein [Anaerohalosphaera sp.]
MIRKNVKAYSLAELIIVVVVISALAAIALPRFNFAIISNNSADTFAQKIKTDLRRTRSLAISNAATNSTGYELKIVGSGYQISDMGTNEVIDSHDIPTRISLTGQKRFKFGPLGNLNPSSGTQLTVIGTDKTFTIDIVQATGMVKCTED